MKVFVTLFCFLITTFYCSAQVTWEKLFVKSSTDVFRSVQEVPAGGYIAAGYTAQWSSNDTDAYVVRLDVNGDTLWTRTFNGGKKDLFYKVINASDGGFVMCGYSSSYSSQGDDDAYYLKLDVNGNELWHFTYGGAYKERAQDIIQTADGGYALCGYSNSGTGAQGFNSFLIKTDANGVMLWDMKYGGNGYDDANSLKEILPSGDFIMAGQTTSPGGLGLGDIWLVRTNSSGIQSWTQNIGTSLNDNAEYLQLAASGGFIICGSTEGIGVSNDDGYLVKTDNAGVVQWYKTFGGSSPDDFHRVENTSDGGYILTGTTQSNSAIISNIWFVKTDVNGDSTWAYTFGGANHDHGYSGVQTSDGGYILCGYSASFGFNYEDALVIKVDGSGLLYNHLFYATVTALVSPTNGSCGNNSTQIIISVRNFGDTTLSIFPDTVEISGAANLTLGQTFTGNISPGSTVNHTFTSTINTSAGGTFNFHCFTSTNNDVYPAMNWYDATITILAQPAVSLGPDTIHTGSSSYLLDAGAGFSSYLWSTGELTSSITVNGISGNYCVTVTNAGNCTNSDCVYLDFLTGVVDPDFSHDITVTPNPGDGNISVLLGSPGVYQWLDVMDETGRIVFRKSISGAARHAFYIEAEKGVYFLRLSGQQAAVTKQIIIE